MEWDARIPADIREILDTAALLEINEFQVFERAYRCWYGRRAEGRLLEGHFAAYLLREIVPPWVHHFTRRVLREHRGPGDKPGARRIDKWAKRTAMLYPVLWLVVFLVFSATAFLRGGDGRLAEGCFFPPCMDATSPGAGSIP